MAHHRPRVSRAADGAVTALSHPKSSAEITVEWLNEALGQAEVTRGATVTSLEREVIGEGAGFVGEMTRFRHTTLWTKLRKYGEIG